MKRNLLAIAIPALLVAASANASIEVWNKDGNKVDFNGRVKAANQITDRHNTVDGEGDDTSARFGMSGQTQITDSVTGYGRWEYQANAGEDDGKSEVRYAFAGLNFGDFGSFDYGRNDGVLKAITAYTDVLPQFGGDASNNGLYVLSGRAKAVATYRNSNFFGLTDDLSFALQYADNGDNTGGDLAKLYQLPIYGERKSRFTNVNKEAYGANVQWNIFDTGLTAGAGYAQSTSSKNRSNAWTVGLKYDNNDLHLAAIYSQSKLKNRTVIIPDEDPGEPDEIFKGDGKNKGFELVAQYGIDLEVGRLTPSLAYVQHKVKFVEKDEDGAHSSSSSPLVKYVSLGAEYALNKNFSAIAEYKFNLLDKEDLGAGDKKANTKDVLGVGLIYQF